MSDYLCNKKGPSRPNLPWEKRVRNPRAYAGGAKKGGGEEERDRFPEKKKRKQPYAAPIFGRGEEKKIDSQKGSILPPTSKEKKAPRGTPTSKRKRARVCRKKEKKNRRRRGRRGGRKTGRPGKKTSDLTG